MYLLSPALEEPSTTCLLSTHQVQDIQSTDASQFYMVVNEEVIADQSVFELYVKLVRRVNENAGTKDTITDIWLSRAPCKICMQILEYAFSGSTTKPTMHVDSWQTNNDQRTTYGTVLQGMGCLSTLKSHGYRVVAWDWEKFHEETDSNSCNHYTNNLTLISAYAAEKESLKQSLPLINGLDELCHQS